MMLYNMLYYNALKERGTRTPILIIIKTIQIIVITIIIMTFIMIITIRIFRKSLLIKMSLSLSLSLSLTHTHTHTLPQVLSVVLRNLKVQSPILPTITMAAVLVVVMVVVVGLKEVEVRIMQIKVYSSRVKVEVSNNLTTAIIREPISKVTVLSTYGMIHIPSRSCSSRLYSTLLSSPPLADTALFIIHYFDYHILPHHPDSYIYLHIYYTIFFCIFLY